MAELDKKIAGLEEEIEGYKAEYKTFSAAQEKSDIRQTINTSRETLITLPHEKKSPFRKVNIFCSELFCFYSNILSF